MALPNRRPAGRNKQPKDVVSLFLCPDTKSRGRHATDKGKSGTTAPRRIGEGRTNAPASILRTSPNVGHELHTVEPLTEKVAAADSCTGPTRALESRRPPVAPAARTHLGNDKGCSRGRDRGCKWPPYTLLALWPQSRRPVCLRRRLDRAERQRRDTEGCAKGEGIANEGSGA